MRLRPRHLLLLLVQLWAITLSGWSQDGGPAVTVSEIIGSYNYSHQFGGQEMTFAAGGVYSSKASDCTTSYASEGTYKIVDGVIVVTIATSKSWPHGQPDQAQDKSLPGGDAQGNGANRKEEGMQLLPIKWGERRYLIHEDELLAFCNAINIGVEPRKGFDDAEYYMSYGGAYYGAFYLHNGDEKKAVSGFPELPEAWRAHLLQTPIRGEVLSVDKEETAIINVGSRSGLKTGMRFIVQDGSPQLMPSLSIWSGLEVISVEAATAKVKIYDKVKAGDVVSTKYQPPKIE